MPLLILSLTDLYLTLSLEDYRGPSAAGYFKWVQNPETGEMTPVTRMKEVNVEKKTRF